MAAVKPPKIYLKDDKVWNVVSSFFLSTYILYIFFRIIRKFSFLGVPERQQKYNIGHRQKTSGICVQLREFCGSNQGQGQLGHYRFVQKDERRF